MIDYLSLALGHGLLAIALFRLVMRNELDVDPEIQALKNKADEAREAASVAGRNARRRKQSTQTDGEASGVLKQQSGSAETRAQAAKR